jgi:hypothetical protein
VRAEVVVGVLEGAAVVRLAIVAEREDAAALVFHGLADQTTLRPGHVRVAARELVFFFILF